MSTVNIPELHSLYHDITWRLAEQTTDHANTRIPGEQTIPSLAQAIEVYEKAILAKSPYHFSLISEDRSRSRRTHFGFFTNQGLEIAAIIDEKTQTIFLGSRKPSLDVSPLDMPIALPFAEVSPKLWKYLPRLQAELIAKFDDMAVLMTQTSRNKLEIDMQLRKMRDELKRK